MRGDGHSFHAPRGGMHPTPVSKRFERLEPGSNGSPAASSGEGGLADEIAKLETLMWRGELLRSRLSHRGDPAAKVAKRRPAPREWLRILSHVLPPEGALSAQEYTAAKRQLLGLQPMAQGHAPALAASTCVVVHTLLSGMKPNRPAVGCPLSATGRQWLRTCPCRRRRRRRHTTPTARRQ